MKKLLISLALLLSTLTIFAQGKISGRVIDASGAPLEFVTVTLHRAKDSVLVKGALTDAFGKYEFEQVKNGSYHVVAAQVGLKKILSAPLSILDNTLIINELKLVEETKTLGAVTVTAQKPFIEHQIDKTVVNVENSIIAAGSTAMEVLEKAPGVIVDNEGKITLRGKEGVRVMVDGKPSQLSQDQLANLLRNTTANLIQKVEIITNPSSKYDAAGNAGIINIVMKKNQLYGLNGQVSSTYGQGVYFKNMNSVNLNYRYGKWNAFGSYNYNTRMNFSNNEITRLFRADNGKGAVTDSFVQTAYNRNPYISNAWRGGVDYNLSNKTTLGILFSGNFGNRNNNIKGLSKDNITTIYAPDGKIRSEVHTRIMEDDTWNEVSANFNVKHTFDSLGREITFDADSYAFNTDNQQNFEVSSTGESNGKQQNNIARKFDIKSLKTDLTYPLPDFFGTSTKKAKFEAGAKTSYVNSGNDIMFYNFQGTTRIIDKNITNDFQYDENINAAYANFNQELKHGISYQVGLRAENTNIRGKQLTTDTSFSRHYTDVFPTAFVMRKWGEKDKHSVRVGYSRRIDRPDYNDLNPFRQFLDRYTYEQGNPNLTPQYSNNFDVSYTFMGAMTVGANYSKTNDAITFTVKQDDALKQSFVTKQNVATLENYGVNLNVPVPIKKWWFVNTSANFFVNRYQGEFLGGNLDVKIPVLNLNIQNRFTLPKDWSAEVSGWYVSNATQGLFVGDPMYAINAGISKQLLDKKLTVRLNAQDIFRTQKFSGYQKYQNLDIKVANRFESQQVRLTATYRFGNQKVQQARRRSGGADDEKNRINRNG
jgi:iron complex outermembrane recepter protein